MKPFTPINTDGRRLVRLIDQEGNEFKILVDNFTFSWPLEGTEIPPINAGHVAPGKKVMIDIEGWEIE